jgi:hypothetical protein
MEPFTDPVTYPSSGWIMSNANGPNAGSYDTTNSAVSGIGGYNDWYNPSVNESMIILFYMQPYYGKGVHPKSGETEYAVPPQNYMTTYVNQSDPPRPPLSDNKFRYDGAEGYTWQRYQCSNFQDDRPNPYLYCQWYQDGQVFYQGGASTQSVRVMRRVPA